MAYEVFISYSHQDQKLREELDTHLANLKRQNIIASWYDGDIKPGEELQPRIIEHLNTAQIILLLVSANFIASDFCYSTEMKQAIARHDANQARVIPSNPSPYRLERSAVRQNQNASYRCHTDHEMVHA
jgi:TIR domain